MSLEKQDILKRMINYALVILILHIQTYLNVSLTPINLMDLLKDNYIIIIPFSYLLIRFTFIRKNKEKNKSIKYFLIEIILLGLTIGIKFMLTNVIFLILLKDKEQRQSDIIEKNVKEYFRNKNHEK